MKRDEPQEPYSSILGGSFDRLVQAYSSYRPGRYTYLGIKHQIPDFMESSEIYVKANCDALRKTRPNAPEALVDYLGFFLTRGCQAMSKKYLEEMPRLTPEQISHLVEVCAMRLPSICDELEEFFK